tara:strand:- start:1396 stop:2028 length:633 start_codon:yes stop_codon:yes gene_type:complete
MKKSLIIACDGEAASGKSTGAKLISKKYNLLLINSGLLYRYASKLILENKPKNSIKFLKKKFKNINYKKITKLNLHTQKIDEFVGPLAKIKNIRLIMKKTQKKLIRNNKRICVEGRDIASTILKNNPRYDIAFYFKCSLKKASYRRWLDLKKKIPLKEVKKSLSRRTIMDKKRTYSPLKKVKDAILIRTDILNKKMMIKKMSYEIDNRFS